MEKKTNLHIKNRHNEGYDFEKLIESYPPLKEFTQINKFGNLSIDFFNPEGVKALNKSLLFHYYGLSYWDIPTDYLTPPIPSRADYIHYLNDLLTEEKSRKKVRCLDIGVGANCIYPIIGCTEYNWDFVASDIDLLSLDSAAKIVENNECLKSKVELRHQSDKNAILSGIIGRSEYFDITICNPPFHSSAEMAMKGSMRKINNLTKHKSEVAKLNFGGATNELWCDGGELSFISKMINESVAYRDNFGWFTSLVSKEESLKKLIRLLNRLKITKYRVIEMQQGNKKSRILCWRF